MTTFLTTPQRRRIAYDHQAGKGPGIVFLGGFRSDMTGTKAAYLARWAKARGRAFLRLDYSGHGQSDGDFLNYTIGIGVEDALAAITSLTTGPQILVGSSMGGWISLLIARARPDLVQGFVGIAAAPDFTEDAIRPALTPAQQADLAAKGHFTEPSSYDPAGYPITAKLLDDGARHLVLRTPLDLPFKVRLLHGTADADVPVSVAVRLIDHLTCPDARLMLVKNADHRFSTPSCLTLITAMVTEVGPS